MLRTIIIAALTACGVSPAPATADPPTEYEPAEPPVKPTDQHFCCQSVDPKTQSGESCETIGAGKIDLCAEVLYCSGNWAKHDGKVYCTSG